MNRQEWHEKCEQVYNSHPLYSDSLKSADEAEFARIKLLTNYFNDQARGSLCDIGSQEGYFAHIFRKQGHHVVAVDSSPRFIEWGKLRYPGVDFRCGFFEDMGFDRCFDYVVCTETLEHIVNPEDFMKAIVKSMNIGAKAFFSVPLPRFGNYVTHCRTWGKREFPEFIKRHLCIDDSQILFRWNIVVATNGEVKDMSIEEGIATMIGATN
jgi:2-polyprenyl-3-methyl-5-hydroxy-6-metoxy-1,4-benzoquinol methylase